jgi:tRNA threonylcarbamoyladenosine biosynthesis protein TsaB
MVVLALDTCLAACSSAVLGGGETLAASSLAMARGHQELLGPMIRSLMAEAALDFGAIDLIAVTVGPGSFTGLRVGLAFAKGLAFALERPCVGVGVLRALVASAGEPGLCAAVIGAGRERVYAQVFDDGRAVTAPDVLSIGEASSLIAAMGCRLVVGPGAGLIDASGRAVQLAELVAPDPVAVARLGVTDPIALRPLYLRAPDARPRQP